MFMYSLQLYDTTKQMYTESFYYAVVILFLATDSNAFYSVNSLYWSLLRHFQIFFIHLKETVDDILSGQSLKEYNSTLQI